MSTLSVLNAKLFQQLDKLATATKDQLELEVKRAHSMTSISQQVIEAHKTQLEAVKLIAHHNGLNKDQQAPCIAPGDMNVQV